MAYRFELSEPFDEGVRRIGRQQIDRALTQLKAHDDPATAIHGGRKSLKRIRALLRLARSGLGAEVFAEENACYRDIARLLSAARDRQVLAETLTALEQGTDGRLQKAIAGVLSRLAGEAPDASHDQQGAIGEAIARLEAGRKRIGALDAGGADFLVAWDGLERTYRQAARAFGHAYESGEDEALHEWRKRVQHHWRHMQLLVPAWPEIIEARIATARRLSLLLGEDHDIALVAAALGGKSEPRLDVTASQRKLITAFATERQAGLRRQAAILGHRLFAENASAFRARTELYWNAAAADLSGENGA